MIRQDNQKYNNDDWLAKEIARENRISAWDLDEGKKIRQEHEENCDAQKAADFHHERHLRRTARTSSKPQGKLSPWFFIDIVAIVLMMMFNAFLPEGNYWAAVLLFLALNPGIFIWLFLFKRLPSERYLKLIFWLAVLLELYELFVKNYRYLRFILWRYL